MALAALIFLRWADFQEAEQEAIAAFDDTDYQPVLPTKYHWRTWHDLPPHELENVFLELPSKLHSFANSRHDTMATQLHRVAPAVEKFSHLPADTLANLIDWLAHQPFETPSDRRALRDVLDSVLLKTTGKESGESFTPEHVAALMAHLAKPQFGESIYDPCFGSAGLLTAALDIVENLEQITHGKSRYAPGGGAALQIAGVEIKPYAYTIGLTRLVLSGVTEPQIELGNSLERTPSNNPNSDGFDVVLANPPWGVKVDMAGLGHYPISTKDSSLLFIQHALSQLRPGGRAVIVVPSSTLYRDGCEQDLRKMLIEQHTIEAVLALPRDVFRPYMAIETNIILLRRGGHTSSIRMIDTRPFYKKGGIPNAGVGKSLPEITPFLCASSLVEILFRDPERYNWNPDEWWDVDANDLADIDYDLTPKRRDRSGLERILNSLPKEAEVRLLKDCCTVMTGRSIRSSDLQDNRPKPQESTETDFSEDLLPFEELESRMRELEVAIQRRNDPDADAETKSRNELQRNELLNELTELQSQLLQHEKNLTKVHPAIPYVRIKDVEKGAASHGSSWLKPLTAAAIQPKWILRAGDILLSKSGTIGKAGIVRNGAVGAIAASGFFVLRVKNDTIDPHYLMAYLQSTEANAWLEDWARGAAAKHLSIASIKELPVPVPPLQIQQRTAEQHRKFGVDALTYLAEMLSEDDSQTLASELNDWVSRHLRSVEGYDGDLASRNVLELLEDIADSECPVNICKVCKHPYHLDYTTHYLDSQEKYSDGWGNAV